jgi:hypothetical protein
VFKMGVLGFLKEHEAHGSESKKPMAELIANADPSDDRALHVQVAFCCFLEPTPSSAPPALGHEHRPLPPLAQRIT